jgi:hypothetical protein
MSADKATQDTPLHSQSLAAAAALAARLTVSGSSSPGLPSTEPPTDGRPARRAVRGEGARKLRPANDDDPDWIARWRELRRSA